MLENFPNLMREKVTQIQEAQRLPLKRNPKRLRKNEEGLREMQDNMKRNNIHLIGIPEGEEEEQGRENLFEKVMVENFPNLM